MTAAVFPASATQQVINEVACRYGLPPAALSGARRGRSLSLVRDEAYTRVRDERPHLTLAQIGAAFGGRDHSTVCVGIQRHRARMAWVECLTTAAGYFQPDLFARAA